MPTRMHFGITAGQAAPWPDLLEMWRFLDRETAFSSAWLFDHFVPGMPDEAPDGACFEAWTALAALAASTQRIRLGVLVSGVTYRNPALVAKMATTVDHASAGRLELGLGAAWHDAEHRMFGYDFPSMRERQDRLEEAVQIVRLLFESDEPVSFNGNHYRIAQAVCEPKPVQQPRPPIVIGGQGERRTLRTLARFGDVMDAGGTPAMMRHKIDVLERHCRAAGRDPNEIERGWRGPVVVSDNANFIERLAAETGASYGLTPEEAKREMPIGTAAHVRETVERYAEAGVTRMIALTKWPWKLEVYRRLNDEVVAAFT
jgi:F420-dependent oxidoreductase-like protein